MSVEPEYQVTEHLYPQLPARISALLGQDVDVARHALAVTVETMIDGLAARATATDIAREIADILARADRSAMGMLGRMAPGSQLYRFIEAGLGSLGRALGTAGLSSLIQTIGRRTGLTEAAALDVAGLVAPVVFSTLAQHQAGHGLSPVGVATLLRQHRDAIRGGLSTQPASMPPPAPDQPPISSFPAPPREPFTPLSAGVAPGPQPQLVQTPRETYQPARPTSPILVPREAGPNPGIIRPPAPSGSYRPQATPPPFAEDEPRKFDWRWLALLPALLLILGAWWWLTRTSPPQPESEPAVAISPIREYPRTAEAARWLAEADERDRARAVAQERSAQKALDDEERHDRASLETEQRAQQRAAAEARREAETRARADAESADARRAADTKARADATAAAAQAAAAQIAEARARAAVQRCQETIRDVVAAGTIRFKRASSIIEEAGLATLERISQALAQCSAARVKIEGHTSTDGGTERNQRLSEARAEAVADYLARGGVDSRRMTWAGHGETRPIAPNRTEADRARNRRIEFILE